jgi:uncharacterized protein YjiS (DUF1127 family)
MGAIMTHWTDTFSARLSARKARGSAGGFSNRTLALVVWALDCILLWQERARSRHQLARLDARMLKDIGLSRLDALREADKPFWRP